MQANYTSPNHGINFKSENYFNSALGRTITFPIMHMGDLPLANRSSPNHGINFKSGNYFNSALGRTITFPYLPHMGDLLQAYSAIPMLGTYRSYFSGFMKLSTALKPSVASGSFQWLLDAYTGFWKLSVATRNKSNISKCNLLTDLKKIQ